MSLQPSEPVGDEAAIVAKEEDNNPDNNPDNEDQRSENGSNAEGSNAESEDEEDLEAVVRLVYLRLLISRYYALSVLF
jgi:hypothetical protein